MSNYPDDTRQFDHDPRSPFYDPPPVTCFSCEKSVPEDECEELETNDHGDQVFCEECMENGDYIEYTVDQL